jgi:hypothetical protein
VTPGEYACPEEVRTMTLLLLFGDMIVCQRIVQKQVGDCARNEFGMKLRFEGGRKEAERCEVSAY